MTQTKTLAALALTFVATLAPGLALAQCAHDRAPKITASACGEGMVWDTAAQTCVNRPSS
jgi:hypothetical protein